MRARILSGRTAPFTPYFFLTAYRMVLPKILVLNPSVDLAGLAALPSTTSGRRFVACAHGSRRSGCPHPRRDCVLVPPIVRMSRHPRTRQQRRRQRSRQSVRCGASGHRCASPSSRLELWLDSTSTLSKLILSLFSASLAYYQGLSTFLDCAFLIKIF